MPDLIRHPGSTEITGFRLSPEWRLKEFQTFYEFVNVELWTPQPIFNDHLFLKYSSTYAMPTRNMPRPATMNILMLWKKNLDIKTANAAPNRTLITKIWYFGIIFSTLQPWFKCSVACNVNQESSTAAGPRNGQFDRRRNLMAPEFPFLTGSTGWTRYCLIKPKESW